jgi:hypothetical protein
MTISRLKPEAYRIFINKFFPESVPTSSRVFGISTTKNPTGLILCFEQARTHCIIAGLNQPCREKYRASFADISSAIFFVCCTEDDLYDFILLFTHLPTA